MRLPVVAAGLALSLMALYALTVQNSNADTPAWRTVTPWAPPEWHPAPEALTALPGINGHSDAKTRGIGAKAAFVYDVDAGQVLLERRADDPFPIASLTKLVSGLALASTHPNLNREFCVDEQFRPSRSGARSRLSTGECYRGWDLLGAALVASDNRAAYGLQVVSGLDYDAFIGRMDEVAADLNMTNSSFADPSGLEDENLASARDITRAVLAVAAHPDLQIAASAPHWRMFRTGGKPSGPAQRTLPTTDKLIEQPGLDVLAAKTGYSNTAGYCFSAVVRTESGRTLAFTLLGANRTQDRWADARRLIARFAE